jgi:acylphosphatase
MNAAPRIACRIVINGRVQGVGFRYALADEARSRMLGGWVRNRRDGTVEALLAGTQDEVEAVIAWARHGPPAARVTSVEVEPTTSELDEFDIVSTL